MQPTATWPTTRCDSSAAKMETEEKGKEFLFDAD